MLPRYVWGHESSINKNLQWLAFMRKKVKSIWDIKEKWQENKIDGKRRSIKENIFLFEVNYQDLTEDSNIAAGKEKERWLQMEWNAICKLLWNILKWRATWSNQRIKGKPLT